MTDYEVYEAGDIELQSGARLPAAQLAYKTYGALSSAKDNVVLMPTFYTGSHESNEAFFGTGRALDPARHFIVSINLMGNGLSSSPSKMPAPHDGPRFPNVTLWDNVACQYRLLDKVFGIERVRLVTGWSMGGCQSYQWAAQYPDMVDAILPFCASAKTSAHNNVFLEGVKAALCADGDWNDGDYTAPPVRGLKAFGGSTPPGPTRRPSIAKGSTGRSASRHTRTCFSTGSRSSRLGRQRFARHVVVLATGRHQRERSLRRRFSPGARCDPRSRHRHALHP